MAGALREERRQGSRDLGVRRVGHRELALQAIAARRSMSAADYSTRGKENNVPEEDEACARERNVLPMPKRRQRVHEAHRLAALVLNVVCLVLASSGAGPSCVVTVQL